MPSACSSSTRGSGCSRNWADATCVAGGGCHRGRRRQHRRLDGRRSALAELGVSSAARQDGHRPAQRPDADGLGLVPRRGATKASSSWTATTRTTPRPCRCSRSRSTGWDHVQGSRFVAGRAGGQHALRSRYWGSSLLHAPLVSLAAGFRYTDTTNGFRAYSRRLLLDPRVPPFRDVFSRLRAALLPGDPGGPAGLRGHRGARHPGVSAKRRRAHKDSRLAWELDDLADTIRRMCRPLQSAQLTTDN